MADEAAGHGKVVTFYSYKGGTGRTMALANVAWILASNGLKVLVVDWDLDSPGLHRYFHPFLDQQQVAATPGVIELINDYAWAAATEPTDRPADWHRQYAELMPHAISVNWEGFPPGGTLDYVSAGRRNRDYTSAFSSIDWDTFYDRLGGGQFINALREDMKAHYDYTLIDSRTGLSDIADICTVHLPDTLVDCFTLNDQSIDGAAAVARNVDQRYNYRNIRVLPVPMRIDEAEKDKADAGLNMARARFDLFPKGMGESERNDYWAAVVIPYKPYYGFEETLAVFGDAPGSPLTMLAAFERLTAAITSGQVTALAPMNEVTRLRYREAFTRRPTPLADIYLSSVPEDRMWADWIEAVLRQAGFRVLPRGGGIAAGSSAEQEAARSAAAASRTVAVVSPAYLRSPQAKGVWDAMALADPAGVNRMLIPVRVGEVRVSAPFSERTVVDLTRRDAAQARGDLMRALGQPSRPAEPPADQVLREPRFPRTVPPVWNLPTRNVAFTGRNEVLERLREQLAESSREVVLPLALYGLSGVGKTQVALEYAHRYMADYDVVWWVPSEQHDLINPRFADLAPKLGLRVGGSITEAAQAAREALRRGSPYNRWLIIFDNADDPGDLEPFLTGGLGHILITSRNPAWSRVADPVEMDVFARIESLEHLQRRVPALSDEDADAVAEALGDLPLAIEQAGAWLAESGVPAATYLGLLESQSTQVLDLSRPVNPTPVALTWWLSFDRLREQSPAAARLLELSAFFAPVPISMSLLYSDEMITALKPYDQRLRERIVLAQLIRELARYSLVRVDRTDNSIQVHRLIQAVIRDQMKSQDDREAAMHEVHRVLVGARPRQGDTDDPANWDRYDWIWPHLGPSLAAECIEEDTRQLLIDRIRYLWKRGEFETALQLGNRLRDLWSERLGLDDRQTLYLRFHVANVLRSQGRYAEALAEDTEILERQRATLGATHPHTLLTVGGLAADLRGLGEFSKALEMDKETYESLKELFGEDEPTTLSAANNLAIDLRLIGDCFAARDLDHDTMSRRRAVLGDDHPYSLHSAAMLARDMREVGDFAGSAELLMDTYRRYVAVLGEDFVDTLRTAESLAVSLRKMGRLGEARELTRDTAERYEVNYGISHPDALACQLNVACDLSALGDTSAAYETASKVLRSYEETLGDEHPFTLAARNNISTYLRGTGSVRLALELADATFTALRAVLGEDHPFTLSCAVNRANCLHDLARFTDAEADQRAALERLAKTLGTRHPDPLICQANLAVTLRASGRTEEATRLQQVVIAEMREVLGEEHPNITALRDWRLQNRDLEV